ncbi:MAG: hypothetical protein KC561_16760, partial [Myxococcales bacterium]|nr:hypothetical protein [Myxococcales bacterium]
MMAKILKRLSAPLGLFLAAAALVGCGNKDGSFWMPPQASSTAADHDRLFYFILWVCVVFFVAIIGAMAYFAVKYKRRSDNDKTSPVTGNHKLELAWSIGPSVILVVFFVWGFKSYTEAAVPPADALEIRVYASQWAWNFRYPNGAMAADSYGN